MHLTLEVKRYHEFFWLRDIRKVNIYKCCAECFIGGKDNRVYYGTLSRQNALIDIDVIEHPKAVAYYLCGLSAERIEFEHYKPNPHGYFTRRQRTCRNWIFANYINDGMLRRTSENGNESDN